MARRDGGCRSLVRRTSDTWPVEMAVVTTLPVGTARFFPGPAKSRFHMTVNYFEVSKWKLVRSTLWCYLGVGGPKVGSGG